MILSNQSLPKKIATVLRYFVITFSMAFLLIATARFYADDGGWVNYVIIAAIALIILAIGNGFAYKIKASHTNSE